MRHMSYIITKNGNALDEDLYSIDLDAKVFHSNVDGLELYFSSAFGWTFKTGGECTFTTGDCCSFVTGSNCTFKTGAHCIFDTSFGCNFYTGCECTFNILSYCTFDTGDLCTFSLVDICSQKFKSVDGVSIILDRFTHKHYVLNTEFIRMQKILKG